MIEPRKENVKLTCFHCGHVSFIDWTDVKLTDEYGNSYGEFNCPVCKERYAVYTYDPIKDIISGNGSPVPEE